MAKILLIEDDEPLAGFVKDYLETKLHQVDHVVDGLEGLAWLQDRPYQAAIIDWQLPGLSGTEICQRFRQGGGATPILMLTANKTTPEVVDGLESGADDYLTKPFEMPELLARLNAALRRAPLISARKLKAGDVELDLDNGTAHVCGVTVKLTRKELGIMELLMRHPERLFSAETILEHVWSTDSDSGPETVRTHMNRLRKSLDSAAPGASDVIESVYGMGYRLKQARTKK